jgi:hypothetical protein
MQSANLSRSLFWRGLLALAAVVSFEGAASAQSYTSDVAAPTSASASNYSYGGDWGKGRVLGRHSFPTANFVPSVLSTSSLGVRAGIEYHQVPGFAQLPSLGTNSQPQAVDLRTINVAETIDFAFRLHDYIAIFGDMYGRARLGANISTLLGTGADYTYGGDVGLLVKILRLGGFQLGARGQIVYYTGQSAGILTLFQDLNAIAANAIARVQSDPNLDINRALNQLNSSFRNATADLLTPFGGVAYGASVNFAQGIGRFVGIQGSVGFTVDTATYKPTMFDAALASPRTTENRIQTVRPSFGLALDVDLWPAKVPVDVIVEYRVAPVHVTRTGTDDSAGESSIEQLLAIGLYYSGRSDLQLGLTGYTLFGQPPALGANAKPSGEPMDLGAQFVFRYFW